MSGRRASRRKRSRDELLGTHYVLRQDQLSRRQRSDLPAWRVCGQLLLAAQPVAGPCSVHACRPTRRVEERER